MLDTLAVAQQLTAGGVERRQAEVIPKAIRAGAEQGDHVTPDQFKAGLAELRTEMAESRAEQRTDIAAVRTEIASLETRLIRWMVGTVLVVCLLNKLTVDLRGVSTVRAGIAVRRPVRPHASNRKVISGTHH